MFDWLILTRDSEEDWLPESEVFTNRGGGFLEAMKLLFGWGGK